MDFLIHHMLRSSEERFPDKEALVHGDQRLSYREVARRTAGLAKGLRHAGLIRSDRIGIYLEPSVPQVLSIFGISESGGVYVPINATLFPEQVAHIAKDCGMKGLITTRHQTPFTGASSSPDSFSRIYGLDGEKTVTQRSSQCIVSKSLCELSGPPEWREHPSAKTSRRILYTSGSTGKPKGVMLSHANVMAGSRIVSTYLGITEQRAHTRGPCPSASTPE